VKKVHFRKRSVVKKLDGKGREGSRGNNMTGSGDGDGSGRLPATRRREGYGLEVWRLRVGKNGPAISSQSKVPGV